MQKRRRLQGKGEQEGQGVKREKQGERKSRSRLKTNEGIHVDKKSKIKDNAAVGI